MATLSIRPDSIFARIVHNKWTARVFKCSALLLIANEIRGAIMAGPILYALWQTGGTFMAFWIAFCTLGGIALSVIVPLLIARKMRNIAG